MTPAVDAGLEFFRQVLAVRGYRQQVLSADIANASTPGFKAVDVDFRQALAAATGSGDGPTGAARLWLVDDPRQLEAGGANAVPGAAAAVKYQVNGTLTLDGNSVDLDSEKTAAAENAVQYEATSTFTSQILRMLTTAVGGSGAASAGGG